MRDNTGYKTTDEVEERTWMMGSRGILVAVVFVGIVAQAAAQAPAQPTVAQLQKEIARLKAELKACREGRGGAVASDPKRDDALAALRAVQSALDGGANIAEFKKYQLEAKIKVDGLPSRPDTVALKEASDLYTDAAKLFVAWQTGDMSGAESLGYKKKYGADETFAKFFKEVSDNGFDSSQSGLTYEYAKIGARAGGMYCAGLAGEQLATLK